MIDTDLYAIGEQDFRNLRTDKAVYVDKTAFVYKIARSKVKYFFLARPRRFGKSLFLSTLRYFFEGKRDLFKELYIDSVNWDWQEYPVLKLDLNSSRYDEPELLEGVLDNMFRDWEKKYDVEVKDKDYSQRFKTIIKTAHEKTGRQVVILVDEYDKPLVSNLNHNENFEPYRKKLANLYSNFKSSAEHILLVFMTGVSRFSKLSVFSDLNNLDDITFSDEYADICGITEKELLENFQEGIAGLSETYSMSYEDVCKRLKKNYDGYRFARKGSEIYNPWSILKTMKESRFDDTWNASGPASVVAEALYNADVDIEKILNAKWSLRRLAGLDLRNANPTALLYQSGYLTIADYDIQTDTVRLKVPNDEIREGLFNELLPFYLKPKDGDAQGIVADIIDNFNDSEPELLMKNLETYFASIPYDLKIENENNFQNALYILLILIGIDTKAEMHTSDGRIDLVVETKKYIYIIELKYDSTPEEALSQIEKKRYDLKYSLDSRKIFKIGVNFSSKTRRIEGWKISN